jgi:hypothetical protein
MGVRVKGKERNGFRFDKGESTAAIIGGESGRRSYSPSWQIFHAGTKDPFSQILPRHERVEAPPENCFWIPAHHFLLLRAYLRSIHPISFFSNRFPT